MALVRAPNKAAARAITAGDPVIIANRGFRYDVLPIADLSTHLHDVGARPTVR